MGFHILLQLSCSKIPRFPIRVTHGRNLDTAGRGMNELTITNVDPHMRRTFLIGLVIHEVTSRYRKYWFRYIPVPINCLTGRGFLFVYDIVNESAAIESFWRRSSPSVGSANHCFCVLY